MSPWTSLGQQRRLWFLICIKTTLKSKEQFLDGGIGGSSRARKGQQVKMEEDQVAELR